MRPALHAVPLALLGLAAALAAARRPTLLVLATHALTSLVAAWVHAEHQKPVLAALASTPVIAILVCVGLLRRSSNDDVFDQSSNSLRPSLSARLRPSSLLTAVLLTLPPIAISICLGLYTPTTSVLALNSLLVAVHVGVFAYDHWPSACTPTPRASPVLASRDDKVGSEASLRAQHTSDWVGTYDDTRLQLVDEWTLSFSTTASRRRSTSTQSSPVRLAARLYSPAKPRVRESYDLTAAFTNAMPNATANLTSASIPARPLSPTPKAGRGGYDESAVSVPAPPRFPPPSKTPTKHRNTHRSTTPPRTPHAPVHSRHSDGTPTSWLSSPGSPTPYPDWSLTTTEQPFAFLAKDPARARRKRASAQTTVSFSDYVSVHSGHSVSHEPLRLSDAPGTVKRLSGVSAGSGLSVGGETAEVSVGGSILGDYSASPSLPLPRSFESLESFRARTESRASGEESREEFFPDQVFAERSSDNILPAAAEPEATQVKARFGLGIWGVVANLLVLGLSAPALLGSSSAASALLLSSTFVPPLLISISALRSPPHQADPERDAADLATEEKRIKYNPRDRSLRPSHTKLLRARPALRFNPPSPLKVRPRSLSAAARLRALRGGVVSAHAASDSLGSNGTAPSVEEHGLIDARISVATKATRSRSPSVIRLDWSGTLPGVPIVASPVRQSRSAPATPTTARKAVPSPSTPIKGMFSPKRSPKKTDDDDDDAVVGSEGTGGEGKVGEGGDIGESTAVAPSPTRATRRRTSALASSGCDFSLPKKGYVPSVHGRDVLAEALQRRAQPRAQHRVVTCPLSVKGPPPPPHLPTSASESNTSASYCTAKTNDSSIAKSTEEKVAVGYSARTPAPPPPSIHGHQVDQYSTPVRKAKSSESASIHRNAALARLLTSTPSASSHSHSQSYSSSKSSSHSRSGSASSLRSIASSRKRPHPYNTSVRSRSTGRGHKSSASWASIKASLQSSLSTIDSLSPRTPASGLPRSLELSLGQSGRSESGDLSGTGRSGRERSPNVPRSHPHPTPRTYMTPWDRPPLRARGPRPRPVPEVGSSYEVSSSLSAVEKSEAEAALAQRLAEGRKPAGLFVVGGQVEEPVKRSPRFERKAASCFKSPVSDESHGAPLTSGSRSNGSIANASPSTGLASRSSAKSPASTGFANGSSKKGGSRTPRSTGSGGRNLKENSPTPPATHVRAGRGRDTSPVRRPRPVRL